MTRKMRPGLAELGDSSEHLLPGLAVMTRLVCLTAFFLSSAKAPFPLGAPIPSSSSSSLCLLSSVCPCLHGPAVVKAGRGSEGWGLQRGVLRMRLSRQPGPNVVDVPGWWLLRKETQQPIIAAGHGQHLFKGSSLCLSAEQQAVPSAIPGLGGLLSRLHTAVKASSRRKGRRC